ncbi:MAG: hypothetical protein A2X86_21910 [Bdellovibrionales bacterium GWA2_49_15]|nr:MAG: hypothetical protein A2X86_21910 [Bdellovibrionales bacterium GWA2_49_15]HAZ12870.1 hypothetical protein [Bdellovibrionales bacterium]
MISSPHVLIKTGSIGINRTLFQHLPDMVDALNHVTLFTRKNLRDKKEYKTKGQDNIFNHADRNSRTSFQKQGSGKMMKKLQSVRNKLQ